MKPIFGFFRNPWRRDSKRILRLVFVLLAWGLAVGVGCFNCDLTERKLRECVRLANKMGGATCDAGCGAAVGKVNPKSKFLKSKMGKKQGRCRIWVWGSRKKLRTQARKCLSYPVPVPVPVTINT